MCIWLQMSSEDKEKLILILGGSGFVSQWVIDALSLAHNFMLTYNKNIDIIEFNPEYLWFNFSLSDNLEKLIDKINPDIVFNFLLSGISEKKFSNNSLTTRKFSNFLNFNKDLVDIAENRDFLTLFLSSDQVFDGKEGLYSEMSQLDPVTTIGKIYAEIENAYEKLIRYERGIIVRSSLLLGNSPNSISQKNLLELILSNKLIKNNYKIINGGYRTPSHIMNLVFILGKILDDNQKSGIFHIPGEYLTYEELVLKLLHIKEKNKSPNYELWKTQFEETGLKLGLNAEKTITQLNFKPITLEEGLNLKI